MKNRSTFNRVITVRVLIGGFRNKIHDDRIKWPICGPTHRFVLDFLEADQSDVEFHASVMAFIPEATNSSELDR
jgi:hypothetical protein